MASGDVLAQWFSDEYRPYSASPARPDTRNNHPVLDFSATTLESATFGDLLDGDYSGGGVTVFIGFQMSSATAGSITVDVAWERIGLEVQDTDSDNFGTSKASSGVAVPAVSGHVKQTSIAFSDGAEMSSVAAGEEFRILLRRDINDGGDTAAGDLELRWIFVQET